MNPNETEAPTNNGARIGKIAIIAFFKKNIRSLIHNVLVNMPAISGFAQKRLGHKRHEESVFFGQVKKHVFDYHGLIGGFEQCVEFCLYFVLVDGHFVVVILDFNSELLQDGDRFIFKINELIFR